MLYALHEAAYTAAWPLSVSADMAREFWLFGISLAWCALVSGALLVILFIH